METPNTINSMLFAVRHHCMCYRFIEDDRRFNVVYPPGYQRDGICASKSIGKAEALKLLLESMETDWIDSLPNPKAWWVESSSGDYR